MFRDDFEAERRARSELANERDRLNDEIRQLQVPYFALLASSPCHTVFYFPYYKGISQIL